MAYIGRQQDGFGVRSRFIYTATGGQTTFDTDDSSNALSYSDGAYVDVYLNGVLLDPSDYTATSLTSIVLDSGASADDVLEVIVYDIFSVFSGTFTNGITASEATVTGDLTVDTNTLYVDSTNSRVGVGTVSPEEALHVYHPTANINAVIESGDANAYLAFKDNSTTGYAHVFLGASGNDMTFFSGGSSERMRLDSSGNLLVGQSSTTIPGVGNTTAGISIRGDDGSFFSRSLGSGDTNNVVTINRTTADGNILGFNKDGSSVGSIGSFASGNRLYFAGGNSALTVLTNEIYPATNTGAASDNTIQLGSSGARFSDLYLGGGVYIGGTGSANLLDDYEEGTFTPGIAGMTFSTADGVYTKIGRRVHCSGIISNCTSGTASAVGAKLSGLPFTVSNNLSVTSLEDGGLFQYWANLGVTASVVTIAPDDSSTECLLYYADGSGSTTLNSLLRTAVDATNFNCRFSFTYIST